MKMPVSALLAAALIASAAAAGAAAPMSGEDRLAKALAGRVAGKPVDCIPLRNILSSEIIDGTAILYRTGGSRIYVNRPASGLNSLDRDDILVTDTHSAQLCSIDTVRLIDRYSQFYSGFVGLSEFVPYTKVASGK